MAGSHQRPFVLTYKSDEIDRLAMRAVEGVRSNKIRPVDYEKLRNLAAEKKFSAHKTLLKVKKFEHLSKQNKESHLLKQHNMAWQKEFLKMNSMRKKLQVEIDNHIRQNATDGGICSQIYQDFEDYQASLDIDFGKFKQSTTEPVWNLREDLQFWLRENMADLRLGSPDSVEKHGEIRQTVGSVADQQAHILGRLQQEELCLERELQMGEFGYLGMNQLERRPHIQQGIPEEAFDLECPDEDLKASVLKEFIIIDEKYLERLGALEEAHEWTLSFDKNGGWPEAEHAQFVNVYDQYPYDLANRRMLILDRLKRQLPDKSRADLVAHEDWWDSYRFFHHRCKGIMADWLRDRKELMEKARQVFMEAAIAHELEEVKLEYTKKQQALHDVLYRKVKEWREQKMEAMLIRAEIAERNHEVMLEKIQMEKEMEKKKRDEEKHKIKEFQDEKWRQRQEMEEAQQRRLEEIQRNLEEQAVIDKERIKYREQQIQKKIEERKWKEEEKDLEEREKEYRLEMLREKVRVVADSNPDRMMGNTQAWHSHLKEDESIDLQKPLFVTHGFTSKQVTSDARVRVEQKLREAGLHTTEYARRVIKQLPPPSVPRRDMESKVFKFD